MSDEQREQYRKVRPIRKAIRQVDGWSNLTNNEIIRAIKDRDPKSVAKLMIQVERQLRQVAASAEDISKPVESIGENNFRIKQIK